MLDIQFIRDNADKVQKNALAKGFEVSISELLVLDTQRRELVQLVEGLRTRRNQNAAKMKGGQPEPALVEEGRQIKAELAENESILETVESQFTKILKLVPNIALDDVPIGSSEEENQVVYEWGDKPEFTFTARNHADIANARGWLDKDRAAKVTGSRFAYIKGDLVRLQQALISWITDALSNEELLKQIASDAQLNVSSKPFTPVLPPLLIKTDAYDAMDRLEPKDDRYKIEGEELWLQGSAEHVLGSMHAGETFTASGLPIRYLGFATSFRKEAGSYGKDLEGIIRMHQFDKLEMESFTTAADGLGEHLFLVALQEYFLRTLGIPYRKLLKCTYDIGKPNARGVDLEAWLPGQGKYRETHTADYMTDYQARRLKTRVQNGDDNEFIHTNDATALALGRGMVAIIENYQTEQMQVRIPDVLKSYLGNREVL